MKVLHDFFSFIYSLKLCSYVSATLELFKLVQVFLLSVKYTLGIGWPHSYPRYSARPWKSAIQGNTIVNKKLSLLRAYLKSLLLPSDFPFIVA